MELIEHSKMFKRELTNNEMKILLRTRKRFILDNNNITFIGYNSYFYKRSSTGWILMRIEKGECGMNKVYRVFNIND